MEKIGTTQDSNLGIKTEHQYGTGLDLVGIVEYDQILYRLSEYLTRTKLMLELKL